MPNGQGVSQPTSDTVLASLAAAADAARQAYLAALAANPGADLGQLYAKEEAALAAWSAAEKKALMQDLNVAQAQADLDAATSVIRSELATIKNISTWLTLLDNLVKLAATVGKYFA
jgi:hypothetical protein